MTMFERAETDRLAAATRAAAQRWGFPSRRRTQGPPTYPGLRRSRRDWPARVNMPVPRAWRRSRASFGSR